MDNLNLNEKLLYVRIRMTVLAKQIRESSKRIKATCARLKARSAKHE